MSRPPSHCSGIVSCGRLRIAAAEGRIDFEELDDRVGQAYSARTYQQLRALAADLPAQPAPVPQHNAFADPGHWS